MRLKYKLFIFFMFAALLPMSILAVSTFNQAKQQLTASVYEKLENIAKLQEERIQNVVHRSKEANIDSTELSKIARDYT